MSSPVLISLALLDCSQILLKARQVFVMNHILYTGQWVMCSPLQLGMLRPAFFVFDTDCDM